MNSGTPFLLFIPFSFSTFLYIFSNVGLRSFVEKIRLINIRQCINHNLISSCILHVFPECIYPVGLERGLVPNEAFSASSWYDVDHEPWLARLYSREGEGAWCALENDGTQYLQVDLAQVYIITGVATQGKYEISEWAIRFRAWVTNFSLSFTDDQMIWVNYTDNGSTPKVSIVVNVKSKQEQVIFSWSKWNAYA